MKTMEEILITRRDGDLLVSLLQEAVPGSAAHQEAADALEAMLGEAHFVDTLPEGRIGMGSIVRYTDRAGAKVHTVCLVPPVDADAGQGRVSVLSPIGRALLGRRAGASVCVPLPGGREVVLEVIEVTQTEDDRSQLVRV